LNIAHDQKGEQIASRHFLLLFLNFISKMRFFQPGNFA